MKYIFKKLDEKIKLMLLPFFIVAFVAFFTIGTIISAVGFAETEPLSQTTGKAMVNNKSKVYKLFRNKAMPNAFIGTGFALKYKNTKYLMTAGHICAKNIESIAYLSKTDNKEHIVHFSSFKVYKKNDLCVLGVLSDKVDAFSLSSADALLSENYFALGHPNGYPLVATQGNILSISEITMVANHIPDAECLPPRYILTTESLKTKNKVCVFVGPNYTTSIPVKQGSSGSPIFNDRHQVVGVISTVDENSPGNWAGGVPLDDIIDFVKSLSQN
jgi:S1-C subfamily serine protease